MLLIDRQTYVSVFGKSGSTDGYYHSHQRKIAKQDMDDAFHMRNKIIAGMVMFSAVSLALFAWCMEATWKAWMGGALLSH